MDWIYLLIAGIFEMGWPLGLKLTETVSPKWAGFLLAAVSITLSTVFLWLAQKTIPIGTAYAVWTGIGAVGTLIIGIVFFGDSAGFFRLLSAFLIVVGIVGLKVAQ